MNASFEERSVWITLLGLVAVFGIYFVLAGRMLFAGVTATLAFVPVFALSVALLVMILVIGHIVVAIASRPDGRDERDRLISWRAEHNSSWVLGVAVLAGAFGLALGIERAWIANGLLMALFVSEILNRVLRLYSYRRGI